MCINLWLFNAPKKRKTHTATTMFTQLSTLGFYRKLVTYTHTKTAERREPRRLLFQTRIRNKIQKVIL